VNKAQDAGATPLYTAAQNGHVEVVRLLLRDDRIQVNKARDMGATPFYIACENNRWRVVLDMLKCDRLDPNIPQIENATGFYIACQIGNCEVVECLLESERVDYSKKRIGGVPPFTVACEKGHLNIIKSMYSSQKIDFSLKRDDGVNGMLMAVRNGHYNVVEYLIFIEHCEVVNFGSLTPKMLAKKRGYEDIYLLLDSYDLKRDETDFKIKKKYGFFVFLNSKVLSYYFAYHDGYFQVKRENKKSKEEKFFLFLERVPYDIKMLIVSIYTKNYPHQVSDLIMADSFKRVIYEDKLNNWVFKNENIAYIQG